MTSGRFGSSEEVVAAGLRALEMEEADQAELRSLQTDIEAGLASGIAEADVFEGVRARANLLPRAK